ncbi:50S ribosomal protein L19e [archaeon]|nr:50S ribosomal protein L19e [archaeon]
MAGLKSQKKMAARIMKCGTSRVWIDPAKGNDIAEAITSADIRKMISDGIIKKLPKMNNSTFRIKKKAAQKKKGRQKGTGSRKGKKGTRLNKKKSWMSRIRSIRKLLVQLKTENKIDNRTYRMLYIQAKSGSFRSRAHVMIYIERNNLMKKEK